MRPIWIVVTGELANQILLWTVLSQNLVSKPHDNLMTTVMPTLCKPHANLEVPTSCQVSLPTLCQIPHAISCANLMPTVHTNLMQISCQPHANLMQTSCQPHANLMSNLVPTSCSKLIPTSYQGLCQPHAKSSCQPRCINLIPVPLANLMQTSSQPHDTQPHAKLMPSSCNTVIA